jgi:hypothetical protein
VRRVKIQSAALSNRYAAASAYKDALASIAATRMDVSACCATMRWILMPALGLVYS